MITSEKWSAKSAADAGLTLEALGLRDWSRDSVRALQASVQATVDGWLGPLTIEAWRLRTYTPDRRPVPLEGKGIWIRYLKRECGTPEKLIAHCKANDISWVAALWMWQHPFKLIGGGDKVLTSPKVLRRWATALEAAGIQFATWSYARPELDRQATLLAGLREIADIGCVHILDVEAEWYGVDASVAAAFVADVRNVLGSMPVLVTTYGAPFYHGTFPFMGFRGCDGTMPQVYDAKQNQGAHFPARCVQAWLDMGWREREVCPILAAFGEGRDGAVMANYAAITPLPGPAVSWWDWAGCALAASRWRAIRDLAFRRAR